LELTLFFVSLSGCSQRLLMRKVLPGLMGSGAQPVRGKETILLLIAL